MAADVNHLFFIHDFSYRVRISPNIFSKKTFTQKNSTIFNPFLATQKISYWRLLHFTNLGILILIY